MKKTLLLTIVTLITAWSAMAPQHLPDKDWAQIEGPVTYSPTNVINIHITGTGDNQYDWLHITGTLTPGKATLNVFPCYTPALGDRFVIFKAPTIDGEFSNPPLIDTGGNFFVLSYESEEGSNNDLVVLTAVSRMFGLNIGTSGSGTVEPDLCSLEMATEPAGGGNVVPTQASFKVCDDIDILATTNEGYAFTHWTQQGGAIIFDTEASQTTATMPARDVTITANFCELPGAPVANDATGIATNTFTANWDAVPGALN